MISSKIIGLVFRKVDCLGWNYDYVQGLDMKEFYGKFENHRIGLQKIWLLVEEDYDYVQDLHLKELHGKFQNQ